MSVSHAFCEQCNRTVDIRVAEMLYCQQQPPRSEFTFHCAHESCRNASNPLIEAINYRKRCDGITYVQTPHFRLIHHSRHASDCPWVEFSNAVEKTETEEQRNPRLGSTAETRIVDELESGGLDEIGRVSDEQLATVHKIGRIPDPESRKEPYRQLARTVRHEAISLESIVEIFRALSENERNTRLLRIDSAAPRSYAECFRSAARCEPTLKRRFVYHGEAKIEVVGSSYRLRFKELCHPLQHPSKSACTVTVFLRHNWLSEARKKGQPELQEKLSKKAKEHSGVWHAGVYVIGATALNKFEGTYRVDIDPETPGHVVIKTDEELVGHADRK